MIQLATEPPARRTSYRPAPSESKGSMSEVRRGRTSHAWPFLSRYAVQPSQRSDQKSAATDSGS